MNGARWSRIDMEDSFKLTSLTHIVVVVVETDYCIALLSHYIYSQAP